MSVDSVLKENGILEMEGHCGQVFAQQIALAGLVLPRGIDRVMEIGFNAGHSAELFLSIRSDTTVTSFDLGAHRYVQACKEEIDRQFPGRHTLVLGDSAVTVPDYVPEAPFDLIFVDGDHSYLGAQADLRNCARLARKGTIVVMDDTDMPEVFRAWKEANEAGLVREMCVLRFNLGGSLCRAMSWGMYLL